MPIILFSKGNTAGETIAGKLVENFGFREREKISSSGKEFKAWENKGLKLVELPTMHMFSDYVSEIPELQSDLAIIASTHKSGTDTPAITVHPCGNFSSENKLGGNPRELAFSSAKALSFAYSFLKERETEEFPVYMEATHHGPTALKFPVMFAEIGSTEKEYGNEKAAELVAEAIMQTVEKWQGFPGTPAVAFGGTHYCTQFVKELEEGYLLSHVCSKHYVSSIDREMVEEALRKTVEKAELVFFDDKMKGAEKAKIKGIAKDLGIECSKA